MATGTLSKEKLLAYLVVDDIQLEKQVLDKATDNDAKAFSEIADIYHTKKDYAKAMNWYLLAADNGDAYSQYRIGKMYYDGEGVSVNYKLAMEWYIKAHNNGNNVATNCIGFLYYSGYGVEKNYTIAKGLFLESANKGYANAKYNVGICYEYGRGVKIDKQYALEWYEKSALHGYEGAKPNIEKLNKEGFYIDDRQKKYLQLEKDMKEQTERNNELEYKLMTAEKKLRETEQERNEKELKNKLLNQENEVLKLRILVYKKEEETKSTMERERVRQLLKDVSQMLIEYVDLDGISPTSTTDTLQPDLK